MINKIKGIKEGIYESCKKRTGIMEILYIIFFTIIGAYKCMYLQFQNRINFRPLFSRVNLYMMFSTMCFLMAVVAIVIIFNTKNKILILIFNLLLSVLLFADALYFRYYNTIITVPVIYNAKYLGSVGGSILSLVRKSDILYFLDIPLLTAISFVYRRKIKTKGFLFPKRCVAALLLILLSFLGIRGVYSKSDISEYDANNMVKNLGIGYFHYYDIKKYAKENLFKSKALTSDEIDQIISFFEDKSGRDAGGVLRYAGLAKGKNLIIIQMEALQEFVINREVNGKEITPNLNNIINDSLYFNNIYVQVAGGNTSDAELMTNASLYPSKEGAAYFRFATNKYKTIPRELKKEGYKTYSLHAYGPAFWNRTEMYKAIGFERFVNVNDYVLDEYIGWGGWALSDDSFYRQSMDIIDVDEPFYSFFITLSGHHPYTYFEDKDTFDVGKYSNTYLGNYIKAQNYADAAVGRFLERLKKMGLYENSLIVIYGDHTGLPKVQSEGLLEFVGNDNSNVDWIKLQKVPLIIHYPQIEAERIEKVGGQVDVFAIVANLMGFEHDYAIGKDVLNCEKGYAVQRNGSVLTDDYFYSSETDTVYDLIDGSVLDKELYKKEISKYQNELDISDLILEKDAFRKLTID